MEEGRGGVGGGQLTGLKRTTSMNDGGINVREGEGDMPPELLLMAMVSCYLCNGSISNLCVRVCAFETTLMKTP